MNNAKRLKIEQIKTWINDLTAMDQYNRDLLKGYNGDELERMTLKEIEMLTNYIRAVYHFAFHKGRDLNREHKKTV